MILATGSRTERLAMALHPALDDVCFVEVGDYAGTALRKVAAMGFLRTVFVGMAGKITKLAAGTMMTHFRRSKVDGKLLAAVARSVGAPAQVVAAATATETARHFFETCLSYDAIGPLTKVCEMAKQACEEHTGGKLAVDVLMADFDGRQVVARA